jgi:hypothetical protein
MVNRLLTPAAECPGASSPTGQAYDEDTPVRPLPRRADRPEPHGAGRGPRRRARGGALPAASRCRADRAREEARRAQAISRGENLWSTCTSDLVELYLLALDKAPPGAFYYVRMALPCANGENSMREACQRSAACSLWERAAPRCSPRPRPSGARAPRTTPMGSNSRVRPVCARRELGWAPHRRSLLEDIEHGSYNEAS